jgi:hypothetical protein
VNAVHLTLRRGVSIDRYDHLWQATILQFDPISKRNRGRRLTVLKRLASILIGQVVLSLATVSVRADAVLSVPGSLTLNPGGANGFWSVVPYQSGGDSSSGIAFGLSGMGAMGGLHLGAWPQGVFSDLTWAPEKFTVTPGYGPIEVTWTALSAGEYTLTSSVLPVSVGGGGSAPHVTPFFGGGSGSGSQPGGGFSAIVSFNSGDTFDFLATDAGGQSAGGPLEIEFGPASQDPVPEPATAVSLLGVTVMGLFSAVAVRRRRIQFCPPTA